MIGSSGKSITRMSLIAVLIGIIVGLVPVSASNVSTPCQRLADELRLNDNHTFLSLQHVCRISNGTTALDRARNACAIAQVLSRQPQSGDKIELIGPKSPQYANRTKSNWYAPGFRGTEDL